MVDEVKPAPAIYEIWINHLKHPRAEQNARGIIKLDNPPIPQPDDDFLIEQELYHGNENVQALEAHADQPFKPLNLNMPVAPKVRAAPKLKLYPEDDVDLPKAEKKLLTIKDRFRRRLPQTNEEIILEQVKSNFPNLKNSFVGFNTFVGIEIEAEGCYNDDTPLYQLFPQAAWVDTTDGSLRGGGREFISLPIRGINIEGSLQLLASWMKLAKVKPTFSHRTSVHVHMNCLDLTEQQVRYIVLTYLAFEDVLFNSFIRTERQSNIYCVPIGDMLSDKNHFKLNKWFKYAALNLLPLQSQGTIEFRQLEGTLDVDRIKTWIKLLNHIFKFGSTKKKEEIDSYFNNLNTDSGYLAFGEEVFGKDWTNLKRGDLLALMEDNILLCKLLKDKELF